MEENGDWLPALSPAIEAGIDEAGRVPVPILWTHHRRRPEDGDRHPARVAVEQNRRFKQGREPVPVFLHRAPSECEPL